MIDIKEILEDDSYKVIGYYSESHVDKDEFVKKISERIKEDIENNVWYKEEGFGNSYITTLFTFSRQAKEGYIKMTRYYL